ncbi:MAG: xanthine dehydrogenase family protein subunit M [Rhodospirillaceae bacterium]|nr:xanthine dehydrogenase family protein subunit M [Rhodospirillaceae bacterium]
MRYEAPQSLDAAVALLAGANGGGKILAGGTDVLVQLHAEMIEPDVLVDIKNIADVRQISEEAGAWRVGAAVPGMQVIDDAGFSKAWPGVCEGVALIGSVQVKGRASIGGNVCNGSPAADSVPGLIAADAVATIIGPDGTREEPVENIVTGPGKTSLGEGEFIVSFGFPARPPHSGDCYLRLTPRTEMDIAVVGVGANLTLDDSGVCTAARIAVGAVAPTPLLVADAAAALVGTTVGDAAMEGMIAAVRAACNPISDKRGTKEYRIKTAGVIARRAVEKALERAKAN